MESKFSIITVFLKISFIFVTGKDKTVEHTKLYINGMTCINCQTRIQNALKKLPGITRAAVSYETETADVLYDSSVISLEQIQGLIDELGYSASVQKTSRAKIVNQTLRELDIIVILYFLLRHFGILNYLAPASLADAQMGYGMLFVIGLITSVHCIAMCGGINLSQTLQKILSHLRTYLVRCFKMQLPIMPDVLFLTR